MGSGFGEVSPCREGDVEELLVNILNEIAVADEISGFHSILIDERNHFFGGKGDAEELDGRRQAGDEFVLDAVAPAQFIVVFEECFDADLFAPDFGFDVLFDFAHRLQLPRFVY